MQENSQSKLLSVASIICVVAASLGGVYLWSFGGASSALTGCAEGAGCDAVLSSAWSRVLELPVVLLGVGLYVLWLASRLLGWQRLSVYLSFVILFGALWFVAVQGFILQAFCPWCCGIHALAVSGALLWLFAQRGEGLWRWASFALLSVGVMAGVQVLKPSESGSYQNFSKVGLLRASDTEIQLYDTLLLSRGELPTIVKSKETSASVLLSDYTCAHCLELKLELEKQAEKFAEVSSLYFLPVYNDSKSREVNRVMLIVRKADYEVYLEMLAQLAAGGLPFEYAALKKLANEKLAGHYELYFKAHFSWTEKVLKWGVALKELNQEHAQAAAFPQVLLSSGLIEGAISVPSLLEKMQSASEGAEVVRSEVATQRKDSALTLEQTKIDLGRLTKNVSGFSRIIVRNSSEEAVAIKKIGVTCGCLILDKSPRSVPAGGEFEIPFEFSTKKFLGKVTHSILLYEEGVSKPTAVPVSANVWLPVRIFPYKNHLGKVVAGQDSEEKKIPIIVSENEPVLVTLKGGQDGRIVADLATVREGRHYELTLQAVNMSEGAIDTSVALQTDHPNCPEIVVPVKVDVAQPVEWKPRAMTERIAKSRKGAVVSVWSNDRSVRESFQIESARYVGAQSVKVTIEQKEKAGGGKVLLALPEGFDWNLAKQEGAHVEVSTSETRRPIIRVFIN